MKTLLFLSMMIWSHQYCSSEFIIDDFESRSVGHLSNESLDRKMALQLAANQLDSANKAVNIVTTNWDAMLGECNITIWNNMADYSFSSIFISEQMPMMKIRSTKTCLFIWMMRRNLRVQIIQNRQIGYLTTKTFTLASLALIPLN